MPLQPTDIVWRYSQPQALQGNTTPQNDPTKSLGKFVSTSEWSGGQLHDLFDIMKGRQNSLKLADYRCVFLCNLSTTDTWKNVQLWINWNSSPHSLVRVAVDPLGPKHISASQPQALVITSVWDIPSYQGNFLDFMEATSGSPLIIGDLPPQYVIGIWLERRGLMIPATTESLEITAAGDD